ncbi:sulfatase-like hydrolase/transferase [Novipirellula artificiosorum]|nr:sulfatase-like hydrolase/transferase [Novipirellula artificiosorum]
MSQFFCTTPVCSPARAAFMTGRYASQFGITDFIPKPGHKLYDPDNQMALDPDKSVTFAEVLQQNGYQTGLVGKWHLGDWTAKGSERFHPTHHGFDYFMGLTGGGTTPSNPELEEKGEVRKFTGLTIDILTDHALKFIERQSSNSSSILSMRDETSSSIWWKTPARLTTCLPTAVRKSMLPLRNSLNGCSRLDRKLKTHRSRE